MTFARSVAVLLALALLWAGLWNASPALSDAPQARSVVAAWVQGTTDEAPADAAGDAQQESCGENTSGVEALGPVRPGAWLHTAETAFKPDRRTAFRASPDLPIPLRPPRHTRHA